MGVVAGFDSHEDAVCEQNDDVEEHAGGEYTQKKMYVFFGKQLAGCGKQDCRSDEKPKVAFYGAPGVGLVRGVE